MESISFTCEMTEEWRKFRDEQLKEMQDEQKRVEDMLLKKIDEFLSKHVQFNPDKKDDKLLDAVTIIAFNSALIGWNECFNYHFKEYEKV
jgi:hypothetical protein